MDCSKLGLIVHDLISWGELDGRGRCSDRGGRRGNSGSRRDGGSPGAGSDAFRVGSVAGLVPLLIRSLAQSEGW